MGAAFQRLDWRIVQIGKNKKGANKMNKSISDPQHNSEYGFKFVVDLYLDFAQ